MPIMDQCTDILIELLDSHSSAGRDCDMKQMMNNFTLDVITKAAFGADIDCQQQPDVRTLCLYHT